MEVQVERQIERLNITGLEPMSETQFRPTRRQVLAGLTTASAASIGAGATVTLFDDSEPEDDPNDAAGRMTLAVTGSGMAVRPSLVAAPLTRGASASRVVQVVNRSGAAARPTLQFWHGSTDAVDRADTVVPTVSVTMDDETLREGTFGDVFDGTVSLVDRLLDAGGARRLTFDWRLPDRSGNVGDLVGVVRLWFGDSEPSVRPSRHG